MKKLIVSLAAFASLLAAQSNTQTQTSITAAMTATQNYVVLASATNVAAAKTILIDSELMVVGKYYTAGLNVPVTRNTEKKSVHASGTMALVGKPAWFATFDPFGGCTAANTLVTPYVTVPLTNVGGDARQWLCSTVLNRWVPGWNNDYAPAQITAAVASASTLTPSGQLFHVTGTTTVTAIGIPVGFAYGSFTVIPDGVFAVTGGNNIAISSTAVVSKPLTYIYDPNTSKFYPSY